MSPYGANYVHVGPFIPEEMLYQTTTTTGPGSESWDLAFTQEPIVWADGASWIETFGLVYHNKIEKALGSTHYVKNNKLYRR